MRRITCLRVLLCASAWPSLRRGAWAEQTLKAVVAAAEARAGAKKACARAVGAHERKKALLQKAYGNAKAAPEERTKLEAEVEFAR